MSRVTRLAKWVDSNGSVELLRRWDLGGNDRVILAAEIGYLSNGSGNVTGLYNQLTEEGYIGDGSVRVRAEKTDSPKAPRGKAPDMPQRVLFAVAKALNIDLMETDEPIGWYEYCLALGEQGEAWLSVLITGKMTEKALAEFNEWRNYHVRLDMAREQSAKRTAERAVIGPVSKAIANARKAGLTSLADDLAEVLANHGIALPELETETDETETETETDE